VLQLYGTFAAERIDLSLRPDVGSPDYLGPFFSIRGYELAYIGGRARKNGAAQIPKASEGASAITWHTGRLR
jgi:hypothetical protein